MLWAGMCAWGGHKHVILENGRPHKARVYPPKIVSTLVRALGSIFDAEAQREDDPSCSLEDSDPFACLPCEGPQDNDLCPATCCRGSAFCGPEEAAQGSGVGSVEGSALVEEPPPDSRRVHPLLRESLATGRRTLILSHGEGDDAAWREAVLLE